MEKRYYWMKFRSDFFESKRIKKLCSIGAIYLVIYLKMQLKSLPTDGVLEFTGIEEDFAAEVALDINEKTSYVRKTVDFLLANQLLVKVDDNTYLLPWVTENIGSETASTMRSRDYRKRKALQCNTDATQMQQDCNDDATLMQQSRHVEKEIEIEIDKEKYKRKQKSKRNPALNYAQTPINESDYNKLLVDLTKEEA